MLTPPTTAEDEAVVLTQLAEAYRTMAHVGVHEQAALTAQVRRQERTIDSLRERLAEKDALIAELDAEVRRYTASMVTEAA